MRIFKYLFLSLLFFFWVAAPAQVVKDNQFWAEYQLILPYRNINIFDTEVGYQTLVSDQDKWRSYHVTPSLSRNVTGKLDVALSLPFYYTLQTSTYNTFETRFSPSVRYVISSGKKIESRIVVRYDWRYVKAEGMEWQTSNRVRVQFDVALSLNRKSFFEDKMLYGIVDLEYFIVVDQNINERFANIIKSRMGFGYRLDYKNRFELVYQVQKSRQTIDSDFDTRDNIFRIRYIIFLNPSKPVNVSN